MNRPLPTEGRLMVAVDPSALDELRQELAALRDEIKSVRIVAAPEWLDAGEYARQRGVSRRTVMNWIARGQVESRRTGSKTEVRVSRGA